MSVKYLATAFAAMGLTACSPTNPVDPGAKAALPAIKQACSERDGWSDPAPPAHVYANVYMVGTCGIVSLLVTTPKGHFLIDGATAKAAPGIAENIRKLGFDPRDVRYLLGTHEHVDHVGGLAELKRLTGANFVTRAEARAAMESGVPHQTDPQLGLLPPFEGVKADMIIENGEALRIGNQTLTMIATPGHTPGGASWTWQSCEKGECHQFVFADSLNAVSADDYRFIDHPAYVATLLKSIATIGTIPKCDILIGGHPVQTSFFERLAGEKPLVNVKGCAEYAEAAGKRLEARLAKEAGN
ncbi:MAG TPA: subclass B3 metallo-beta-lactamase [Sphingorhabdus sp.]|jgi:metallo-beta-lactamase class B|nr:subclass B3 metallo-beta-lactamase [Sphingorhabdus sp.]